MKTYRPWAPHQAYWLPKGHLAYFILDVVGELDLSAIEDVLQAKDPRGEKAYDPRMMVAVLLCERAGLVNLGHVSIDGTKVRANASKHKAMSYDRMKKNEAKLREEVRALLAKREASRQFLLRGIDKVQQEWALVCATHNLLKLFRAANAAA